jgi:hypothetical protein
MASPPWYITVYVLLLITVRTTSSRYQKTQSQGVLHVDCYLHNLSNSVNICLFPVEEDHNRGRKIFNPSIHPSHRFRYPISSNRPTYQHVNLAALFPYIHVPPSALWPVADVSATELICGGETDVRLAGYCTQHRNLSPHRDSSSKLVSIQ